MPIQFSERQCLWINYYLFYNTLQCLDQNFDDNEEKLKSYKLSNLTWVTVPSNPTGGQQRAADALKAIYRKYSFYLIDASDQSLKELLINPGEKTMGDLAKYCADNIFA